MSLMNLKSVLRPVRFLRAACVSAFLFFSNVFPAMASSSKLDEGEAQL